MTNYILKKFTIARATEIYRLFHIGLVFHNGKPTITFR